VAAARGEVRWQDLQWEHDYDGMAAYRQSKIAYGLFGLELQRRSEAEGWGITSVLSHPGVAPTSLLAARPEMGRAKDTPSRRLVRLLSRVGFAGTPESAALPALLADTTPSPKGGTLYGPKGPGHVGGPPAEQPLYKPLRNDADAKRIWTESLALTDVTL
jgi:NAD(P)-dependent dehydrogenase (short-subunit alcohol dehydrogenase family)